jgi:hypothetical protein
MKTSNKKVLFAFRGIEPQATSLSAYPIQLQVPVARINRPQSVPVLYHRPLFEPKRHKPRPKIAK